MRFTIIAAKADQQVPQSSYEFHTPGGTIGRGTDNNFILPDSERTISRLQALVHVSEQGLCKITNRGNILPILFNDIPLARGRQVEIQEGDILTIGDYRIEVTELSTPARTTSILQQEDVAKTSQVAPVSSEDAEIPQPKEESQSAAVPSEIWDSIMDEFSISDSISQSPKAASSVEQIEPFKTPELAERNPEDPLAGLSQSSPLVREKPVDTDKLFAEETPFQTQSIFADQTPSTLHRADSPSTRPPITEDETDPLALFSSSSSTHPTDLDDPLGIMNSAPLTSMDEVIRAEDVQKLQKEPEPEPIIPSRFESVSEGPTPIDPALPVAEASRPVENFANTSPEAPVITESEEETASIKLPTPQSVARQSHQSASARLGIDPVAYPSASTSTPQASAQGDVLQGELLEALLEGMGLGDMQTTPQFDRENMQQLGQMISMFSQGTVALLSSRSILKRGVKADMTMVLDDANNPFKLLPSGKTVLMQMFGSKMPGFMPPKKSVRDALIDLQAHQLGMISGIRAIIASMLQSFNPEKLEEEAKREGGISRLSLSASRKAALWDYFVRSYTETAGEIDDDFHTLFGEAFLHAYDMEVNQYKDSQSGSEE